MLFYDRPLFEENLEAWVHGPVVSEVYYEYKDFKYNPISTNYNLIEFDNETLDILNYVKDNFLKYDGKYLEELTHNQEPWIMSREGLDPDERSDKTISKQSIANYFISFIHQPSEEEWE